MSRSASGAPIMAPPPKPMMAMPVAMPRRSGNHLMSVDTGEMYPSPSPRPPMIPEPTHNSQIWWMVTPKEEITRPPHQRKAAAKPALRGPTRSSHPPQIAEAVPRNTKNSVYIHPRVETFQSQLVVNAVARKPMSAGQSIGFVMPIALCNGSQNTENP